MNETFMKEKPVFPLILSMAIPMVVSMLVNSLYNIVDSFFVAQISEDAMTALSLVYPVQNFLNAVSIGFGVGLNAVIAFYLGAGDYKKADMAASQGITLSVIHSVILTIGSIAVMPVFLGMFTSSASILELGLQYSRIAFAFTPVIIFNLIFEKIFQAVGNMKVSMIGLMTGCVANIILDPILIFGLGPFPVMGIHGAALATGMGQALTLIYYLTVYIRRPIQVRIRRSCLRLTRQMAARTLRNRSPRHLEPGPALCADLRPERDPGRLLRRIHPGPWHLLQAADLPLSARKWLRPGHAPP